VVVADGAEAWFIHAAAATAKATMTARIPSVHFRRPGDPASLAGC
jgi:hypothetical protein